MAKTRDYMDYLDSEIGIAPANSQEEFQAAETIVEVMRDHDLEPTIQEFDAHPLGKLMPSILMAIMFVGILLAGLGSTGLRLLGLLLAVVPAVLLLVAHSGNEFLEGMGPASKSQNVIAVHPATGDKVTKGNRPIVIVAHYDTPHESVLFERLAPYQAPLKRASIPCVVVVLVAAVVQILGFLPGGLRVVLWIVGLVAALPLVLLAVVSLVEHFSTCTLGANDNKSSVAALLSVMDRVRPMDDRVSSTGGSTEESGSEGQESSEGSEPASYTPSQQVVGTRHGKDVLEQLGILPDTCEIVYEDVETGSGEPQEAEVSEDGSYDGYELDDAQGTGYGEQVAAEGDYQPADAYEDDQADWGQTEGDGGPSYETYDEDGAASDEVEWGQDEAEATDSADEVAADPSFEEQDWNTDVTYDSSYDDASSDYGTSWYDEAEGAAADKPSLGARIRGAFHTLKERVSSRRSADDVSIPRGEASEDPDFSEFEETDWGEDDWSGNAYQPQEELKGINRDEMIARRSARASVDASEQADEASEESYVDEGYTAAPEDAQPVDWDDEEDYQYQDYEYEDADEVSDDVAPYDEADQTEPDEDGSADRSRTSHDISHDDGPDWAVVEEEQVETEAEDTDFDPSVYDQQDDEQLEDIYDMDADELADVEEELEDDQLSSAVPPSESETTPQEADSASAQPAEPEQADTEGEDTYDDDGPTEGDDAFGEDGLTWDSEDDGESEGDDVLPKDTSGLDNLSDGYEVYEEGQVDEEKLDEPEPIDDPTWGQTSYEPPRPTSNVARRATLYDVPNPSEDAVDPLSSDDGQETKTSDGEDNRSSNWKGGAALRSDERDDDQYGSEDVPVEDDLGDEGSDEAPADEPGSGDQGYGYASDGQEGADSYDLDEGDVQDAILSMADDLLISHDIWFVAVGSSAVNHAGMKAFLSNFRQDIRGAFLINLDSIGAGTPTILTSEGLHAGRRSDRRLVRLISKVADDLHVDLQKAAYRWEDTDATPAMRARVRAVTIMGMDGNGLPALSHTQNDVPENVDSNQVSSIVRVITEAIRRS